MRPFVLAVCCLLVAVSATAAEVHVPSNITAEATGPNGAAVSFSAGASGSGGGEDHNGRPINGPTTAQCSHVSGLTFPLGTTTVTCSATDSEGTDTESFTVTVTDTTAPVLQLPGNITSSSNVVFYTAGAQDLVDGWRPAVCTPQSGSTFAAGTTAVSCTTADTRGNSAAGSFTVTVLAATPPSLSVPADITAEASSAAGAVVTYSASATHASGTGQDDFNGRPDGGGGSFSPTCSPASGSTFSIGTTVVTCTATDSGGTTTKTFNVTVADTTAPSLALPANITTEQTTVTWTATANDLVDGSVAVTCSPASGSTFAAGTTTVNCSAADSHGNSSSGSFTVTVFAPEPPVLSVPDDMTVEATGPDGAAVTFDAYSTGASGPGQDDENGRPINAVTATCSPASGSTFPLGTTTVTCTATNAAGSVSDSFTITVVDTTAPALDLPRDFSMKATSESGAAVGWTAFANDLVDGPVGVTCTPPSGSTFAVGTTHVSCTASDLRGNTATGGFNVTITPLDQPPPPPTLNLPADITVEAVGPDGTIVTFTVTSTGGGGPDDFNGRPTGANVTCAPPSGSLFPVGTTTVQCTAGTASGSFLIHVVDTTAPALTLPDDITTDQTTVTWTATATDVVDGNVAVTCTPASGSTFATGTTTVDCSATDAHNNTATGSFAVTVNDQNPGRTITVSSTPDTLWPPDHKFVQVTVWVEMSDDSAFTAYIAGVTSSENDPNDNTSPDWKITGPLDLLLRSEKSEQAQTRVYTITVEVIDDQNVTHVKTVTVAVMN